ncbi:MAG TPA: polyribonucleotide nucleotidyltransferase [Firmicutes bacterium]|nr:polyribonucleotide nucleotidyltransferase [Bacillota bacterium]
MIIQVQREIAGRTLLLETGRVAKQAHGAVTVRYGDSMVLATAVRDKPRAGIDFFPLTVDYREKTYSAGRIPGGYFKREGRPSEKEILTMRQVDRPVRPLFPDGYRDDIQIMISVLSADETNDPDIISMIGAFAALAISPIPWNGPLGAVRIGRIAGKMVINPSYEELEQSTLNLVVAGSRGAILMVEGGAKEEPEEVILEALDLAQEIIRQVIDLVDELIQKCNVQKIAFEAPSVNESLLKELREKCAEPVRQAALEADKSERNRAMEALVDSVVEQYVGEEEDPEKADEIKSLMEKLEKEIVRGIIVRDRRRVDGRALDEVRPISIEIDLLPKVHGSALFTRGQTQSLAATTLGTTSDEQRIDTLLGEAKKHFMLHYNFPPFCVGESRPIRGPGRREIGHGVLAERAIASVLPSEEEFPYTIRIVSDILESNGSSSMATVCAGCLSLMDAGVPIKEPVAGIAMGLIKEGSEVRVLSDILGLEDHLGDMDFKVTGTRKGITAFQMDLKIEGVDRGTMGKALEQARAGRLLILDKMQEKMPQPRAELKPFAPRIDILHIPVAKIGAVVGPGGKVIRSIIQETGVKIDIEDDGRCIIASADGEAMRRARELVEYYSAEVEIGKIYEGKVVRTESYGAFVQILPGQDGLVHISHLAEHRVERTEDVVRVGDVIPVKVIDITEQGKVDLSLKLARREIEGTTEQYEARDREREASRPKQDRGDRDRGRPSHRSDRGRPGGRDRRDRRR